MNVAVSKPSATPISSPVLKTMRADRFDMVSSMLMAILVLAASCVFVLFSFWITGSELIPERESYYPRTKLSSASSSVAVFEFELPTSDETIALSEPTLQQMVQQVDSVDLASVADGSSSQVGQGASISGRTVRNDVGPDERDAPGQVVRIVPRYQRWHLIFKAPTAAAYGRQLDALKIELAAFGGGVHGIDCAGDFSSGVNSYHIANPLTEKRLYFSWVDPSLHASSPLPRFERSLLTKAGVAVADRQLVKFLPSDLENQLAAMELEYAHSHGIASVTKIDSTVFESQAVGPGYRFVVTRQRYRDSR